MEKLRNFNKLHKFGAAVYFFINGAYGENGLPTIGHGTICGVVKAEGIYNFIYQIESHGYVLTRVPDAIYESLDELKADIENLVAE